MVFAGKEKAQRLSGFLSGVHALEFGPRGRGWSAQLEWVVMGTLADSGPFGPPMLTPQGGLSLGGLGAASAGSSLWDPRLLASRDTLSHQSQPMPKGWLCPAMCVPR